MSSTLKTNHYSLNSWIGSDKPKREDFNYDNQKIDGALHTLATGLETHQEDEVAHITAAERAAWQDKLSLATGSYVGDGQTNRAITLGYKPKAVLVFQDWTPLVTCNFPSSMALANAGIAIEAGGTSGMTVFATGFSVMNVTTTNPAGYAPRLNSSGVTYYYLVLK